MLDKLWLCKGTRAIPRSLGIVVFIFASDTAKASTDKKATTD